MLSLMKHDFPHGRTLEPARQANQHLVVLRPHETLIEWSHGVIASPSNQQRRLKDIAALENRKLYVDRLIDPKVLWHNFKSASSTVNKVIVAAKRESAFIV